MKACEKECVINQELIDKKKIPADSIKDAFEAECRLNPRTGYMEASFDLKRTKTPPKTGSIFHCRYE